MNFYFSQLINFCWNYKNCFSFWIDDYSETETIFSFTWKTTSKLVKTMISACLSLLPKMEHCLWILMGSRDMRTHLGGQHPSERQGLYTWSLGFAVTAKVDEFNIHLFILHILWDHAFTNCMDKTSELNYFFINGSEKGENKDIEPNELGPRSLPFRICRPAITDWQWACQWALLNKKTSINKWARWV